MTRLARIWSAGAAVWSVAVGLLFIFGPVHGGCAATATGTADVRADGTTVLTSYPPVVECRSTSLLEVQPEIWPMPLVAIAIWSLAPTIAAVGVWSAARPRMPLVLIAVALEASVLLSFGAGGYFAPLVLLPLAVTAFLADRARRHAPIQ